MHQSHIYIVLTGGSGIKINAPGFHLKQEMGGAQKKGKGKGLQDGGAKKAQLPYRCLNYG